MKAKIDKTITEDAYDLVSTDRNLDYGHPLDDFTKTAKFWSVVLDTEVTAAQVALCLSLVKYSRELNRHKRDNLVDAIGYLLTYDAVIKSG
jgi:hypothetical protein